MLGLYLIFFYIYLQILFLQWLTGLAARTAVLTVRTTRTAVLAV
jgi:hypothetical protein